MNETAVVGAWPTIHIGNDEYQLSIDGNTKGWPDLTWRHVSNGEGKLRLSPTLLPHADGEDDPDHPIHIAYTEACHLNLGRAKRHRHHALIWNTGMLRAINEKAEVMGLWHIERYMGTHMFVKGQHQSDPEVILLIKLRHPALIEAADKFLSSDL